MSPLMPEKTESGEEAIFRAMLRELRLSAGQTQAAIASSLGKPQSYVSKYESGERILSALELRSICRAFGISFSTFAATLDAKLDNQNEGEFKVRG